MRPPPGPRMHGPAAARMRAAGRTVAVILSLRVR